MPTTTYKSSKPMPPNVLPADYHTVRKEDAHLPLVLMLVLTQLSVGTFLWDFLLKLLWGGHVAGVGQSVDSAGALALGLLALAASTAHLGRPVYAFRAIMGLGHSWLSREILAFALYAIAAALYSLTFWAGAWRGWLPEGLCEALTRPDLRGVSFGMTVLFGLLGVYSSVMVYAVTRRPLWRVSITAFKFFSSTLILGLALKLLVSLWALAPHGAEGVLSFLASSGRVMSRVIMVLTVAKLLQELAIFLHLNDTLHSPYRRAAVLMKGTLRRAVLFRFLAAGLGGVAIPGLLLSMGGAPASTLSLVVVSVLVVVGMLALVLGELLERYLFFTTGVTVRMPGGAVP